MKPSPHPLRQLIGGALLGLLTTGISAQTDSDYGDAPFPYPVLAAENGARHSPLAGFFLGSRMDIEATVVRDGDALGDDNNPPNGLDDEDGVVFATSLVPGSQARANVTVTGDRGLLDAWVDFNRDGAWTENEKIASAQAMAVGLNTVSFTVPSAASAGRSFARFRLSRQGAPLPTGAASGGEVEDYLVDIGGGAAGELDFGDAPEKYPVKLSNGGRHAILKGFHLGDGVDSEKDGQPSLDATGDDRTPAGAPADEDGVFFPSPFLTGGLGHIVVTASARGFIDAFLDFNQSDSWETAEKIIDRQEVQAGDNDLFFEIPSDAAAGGTFLRVRFSSKGGLSAEGLAEDGEVEDYQIGIEQQEVRLDFGDAPDNYPVTLGADGARHSTDQRLFMGKGVDLETEGQASGTATGDDANPTSADDEDGVTFSGALTPGQSGSVTVEVSVGQAALDAWIDFNRNGSWDDAGEKIADSQFTVAGNNTITFQTPAAAVVGQTFARFRVSYQGGLSPRGMSQSGEVEDHAVTINEVINLDFGDAPQNYPVMLGQNGARHLAVQGFGLGQLTDAERDGQPSAGANGDDAVPPTADDEDGIRFVGAVLAGQTATVEVIVRGSGVLDGFVDFNKNGSWSDAGEKVINNAALGTGTHTVTFAVPAGLGSVDTFSRWRFYKPGAAGPLGPTGPGGDGEVEDHPISIRAPQLDFGDAPQSYPVVLAQDGARHNFLRTLHLGPQWDAESNGQASSGATGDDANPAGAPDDEDGVRFLGPLRGGATGHVEVVASATGFLDAWVDFNRDGDWAEEGEKIYHRQALAAGTNNLSFAVPAAAGVGETFTRWRLSSKGGVGFTGEAEDGEVEDHSARLEQRLDPCVPRDHRGTNFWVTFPGNYAPDTDNPVRISVSIVGVAGTTGQVRIPGLGSTQNYTLDVNGLAIVNLPRAAELRDANDLIENKGINVTAQREVAVYGFNRVRYTSDAFLALPSDVTGRAYLVQAYKNNFSGVPDLAGSQFAIVAGEDETTVQIRPTASAAGRFAGVSYTITLNQGETYQLRTMGDTPNDLSGTVIRSDKPISVFGGHRTTTVPSSNYFYADHLVEQLLPVERAGTYFPIAPLKFRSADTYRIMATENSTTVSVDGINVATLNAGEIHQVMLSSAGRIEADKPVHLTQFANSADYEGGNLGDPFMMNVLHNGLFQPRYELHIPSSGFGTNVINVIVQTAEIGIVSRNGVVIPVGEFFGVPGTTYSYAQLTVGTGVHRLQSRSGFAVYAYGWAEFDSYGFPGGTFFGDTEPPQLNCPEDIVVTLPAQSSVTHVVPCTATVPDLRRDLRPVDKCGMPEQPIIEQDPPPGTELPPGDHVITLSVADAAGNVGFCSVGFRVVDPSPVQIDCPENIVVDCQQGSEGAFVQFLVRAQKRCTPVPVEAQPASGSFFSAGTTTVTARAENDDGTFTTCTFTVTVNCGRPQVTFTYSNRSLTLNWGAGEVLETAPTVNGPWSEVQGVSSPHSVDTRRGAAGYYRVKRP